MRTIAIITCAAFSCAAQGAALDLQHEIDAAAERGGGTVCVPVGEHEVKPFVLKQPCEEGLTLIGSLTPTRSANKNLSRKGSLDVNFLLQTIEGTKLFSVSTDSTGFFGVQMPDFNADAPSVMTVTNHKDKRI